jgi:hypothetical protein
MSFWGELRRRNVVKVGVAYGIIAWVLIQVVATVFPALRLPEWTSTFVVVLLLLGLPAALVLAWAFEVTPEGIKRTHEVLESESITHLTGQKLNYIVTGLLVGAVAFMAADNYLFTSSAVKLKSLTVIARTSMVRYTNTDKSIEEIGEELNVKAVMESSVRYANDRVRVTTQLIDVSTGSNLWSETYERDFKDIFAIQADIAMSVANALNASFSPEEQRRIEQAPTTSPEAYAFQLQALDLGGRGNRGSQLLALLDQAIARDPNFAAPYGLKAGTYASLLINTTFGSAGDRAQNEALARSNAEHALALDPTDAQANGALAIIDLFNWRWADARQTYERAYAATAPTAGYFRWFLSRSGQQATPTLSS